MRAAAVEAVRPGFLREFSFATLLTMPSGRTFGNSTGHSGWNPPTFVRIHMISTEKSTTRRIAATKKPRNRLSSNATTTTSAS